MKKIANTSLAALMALSITACTTSSIGDSLPDRRPDYTRSTISNKIEVPPDLSDNNIKDSMDISGLDDSVVANYSDYQNSQSQRDDRGFTEVLPELYKVNVEQPNNQLPYIVADAGADKVWEIVKKYWQYNGIRLAIEEPSIGVMETDWLKNKSSTPQTGVSGFINSVLGFATDNGVRDRYRIRLTRLANNQTEVLVIYNQAKEKATSDFQKNKDPSGFTWELTDNQNPEFQLEITRRIAIYVAKELKSTPSSALDDQSNDDEGLKIGHLEKKVNHLGKSAMTLYNNQPALRFAGDYSLAWKVLGIGLDRASFEIKGSDINTGTYEVKYAPQTNTTSPSVFAALWGAKNGVKDENPEYLVRLADQKENAIAVVQNIDGSPAPANEARALLETVNNAL